MKKEPLHAIFSLALLVSALLVGQAWAEVKHDLGKLPVKGMVTMIDLGANKCIPCKMMAPIIEEVREEYKGKAAIIFLDVWEDRTPVRIFKIRVIPTQIFFDKTGKEVYRHEGFMDKKTIVAILEKLGVNPS